MSVHRYPPQALAGDYGRAGIGLLLTVPPLLLFAPTMAISVMLLAVAGLCLFFLARTLERHRTVVSLGADGLSLAGWRPAKLAWADLKAMQLAYYSIRRDRRDGWMQLTLRADGPDIKIDSRIDDFLLIVREAARAAKTNQILLNTITRSNLNSLRITGD
jgi:Zn-dependent protease with chaperone function